MKEFSIIDSFFKAQSHQRKDVILGIGDDAALTTIPQGQALVTTTDTLIAGVHFLANANPHAIAQKAIAVNLSDLAAMGAEPAWISLSLSLPIANEEWLKAFSQGIAEMTQFYSIQLIGGDTVQGPLAITITAQGFVPPEQALLRSKAKPGDFIYVTGCLGDAGAGLDILLDKVTLNDPDNADYLLSRLHYPTPRLLAGTSLRRLANACIDLSDGLNSDIRHILKASNCGATIHVDKLPLSKAMRESIDPQKARQYALSAGDDYELLFTVSEEQKGKLELAMASTNVGITCIGQMNGLANKLELRLNNALLEEQPSGYQHF
ncbi:MAG: thiamine-phosphate kinase [Paraglaciecola sp.]|uniref:thiamine-phosphate kinase n=1 Tax=Pseudomonadati TaxID=3379134 RepID=UPI00273E49AB|nr:thiamine-phosphate kinase [Paraglaciecola sp.]MDP5030034.1 thiamine-phosphate kinase [Paraglaciecola sp.]MDP5130880.1 thiamine-phosphate kinase [Paraglaciecola sp.]